MKVKNKYILKDKKVIFFMILSISLTIFSIMNYSLLALHKIDLNQTGTNDTIKHTKENILSSNTYQLVDPINISSWSDWALYPYISGNGTDSNPFIIENIEINGTGSKTMQSGNDTLLDYTYRGIFIDANGSFIIQNCKISHMSIGIYLYIGISPGTYHIRNIEINSCSIGIYSRWPHVVVNISNCYIHDCNWVSIKAKLEIYNHFDYGGVGIWVRSDAGSIEDCLIENCAIGMTAGLVNVTNNTFINCGIVPDYIYLYLTEYDSSNTVNGKPIGIFGGYYGDENLIFTQSNASQYGQLIFAVCDNLTLSNIHITDPCSIGIQIFSLGFNQSTHLNDIIIENQKLGMYITGRNIIGDNLYSKNCDAGFYFAHVLDSKFTKVLTDNTEIPIYAITAITNVTIEIEQSTKFYLVDDMAWYGDKLHVESLDTSYNVSISYIPELGKQGYMLQFNDTGIYQASLILPPTYDIVANFTIISIYNQTEPDDITSPVITINEPNNADIFTTTPPSYNIDIVESNIDSVWYTMNNGVNNITITSLSGILDETIWNALPYGVVAITFYANDTAGNIGSATVFIYKNESTTDGEKGIPGAHPVIIMLIVALGVLGLSLQRKQKLK